ncbi:alpha-1,3-mannosyltransferase [Novosphingobium chloroacetimidivorans]|uniref:Alpha-1,3-mannosyltransferase n=1 Tax=Novosphingobium chloroacetimidivorans TaxID=1428314 RepID=A0A7W7NZ09_9SPHN|nr:WecB/TagA/CpsF family glycosyltransferase [Novosphingobium chloroacetimidivorans]MBB4861124.1 alpha-1,3-mannosyltransferase [Novosphingobium chloroacetimidivorans]
MTQVLENPITLRRVGKIDIAVLEKEQALSLVVAAIRSKRSYMICFANAHTANMAQQNEGFSSALQRALVLNDGVGVDLASRWLYRKPFPANLNGTDFTPELLDRLPGSTRLFLLGSSTGVAERAARAINQEHRHIEVVGTQHGFFVEADESGLLSRIAASRADLVLVAMGHPRQEMWVAQNIDRLNVTVMCVGALLDFYAGTVKRAPLWLRKLRMEWIYRLLREPRRLAGRYLIGNATFLPNVLASDRRERETKPFPM